VAIETLGKCYFIWFLDCDSRLARGPVRSRGMWCGMMRAVGGQVPAPNAANQANVAAVGFAFVAFESLGPMPGHGAP
jgi:hypothetical protein